MLVEMSTVTWHLAQAITPSTRSPVTTSSVCSSSPSSSSSYSSSSPLLSYQSITHRPEWQPVQRCNLSGKEISACLHVIGSGHYPYVTLTPEKQDPASALRL